MSSVEDKLVRRYAASLPRYTSYPTANHFDGAIGPADYKSWLAEIGSDAALSLYVHAPFAKRCAGIAPAARKQLAATSPSQSTSKPSKRSCSPFPNSSRVGTG